MSHPELTDIERDGTGELMNVGVGKAAAALGRLVRGEIELSVPRVLLVPLAEVMKYTPIAGDDAVIGVYAAFDGAFKGSIGFVVPASARAQFLRLVLDQDFDADDAEDLEQDLLLEIGNVICNACLAGVANAFRIGLETAPPRFFAVPPSEALAAMTGSRPDRAILLVELDFSVSGKGIRVYLWLAMDEIAVAAFRRHLAGYLKELGF